MDHRLTDARPSADAASDDTPSSDDDPETAGALEAALLSADGGGGAQLRGHVPAHPEGVVLVLHGGTERSRVPVSWWRLAVVRMLPFATELHQRAGEQLAVLRLKNRVRGWNGSRQDPVQDARWAIERIRRVFPGVPIALVGHSMGGRVALQLADEPGVAAVACLAPWVVAETRRPRHDIPLLFMHGTRDRMTDPRRTAILARRWDESGADVRLVEVPDEAHAMLRKPALWHRTVAEFVSGALLGRPRTG
ncbi:alpha/beta hydrolase [Phycicoccus flavus]|uniref:alpha/beta hydrolase n=1 Tax=Phycicoccus flavus TaxID=2502783 RepID=UPI000FEBE0F4|nr:alpha/beta fold hydrolase [Phycicoccus flavus]NHA67483.1 alpha/beta hydrolase [Phycicoccus flavus]